MKISIHQPEFLPWLGFFDKLFRSDVIVLLDDVQFQRRGFQNRNYIKTNNRKMYLTVPFFHNFPQKINEVMINNSLAWKRKQYKAIITSYSPAQYYQSYDPFLKEVYNTEWTKLADLNIFFIEKIMSYLKLERELILSSELNVCSNGTKRLIDICKILDAKEYLSGSGGLNYMDVDLFKKNGISVHLRRYEHPTYDQLYPKLGFLKNMSTLDLLFNHGDQSLEVIIHGGKVTKL